jgi:ribosomal protein S27AE
VFEPTIKRKNALCPYCYDGVIIFDKYNKLFSCCKCNKFVNIGGW